MIKLKNLLYETDDITFPVIVSGEYTAKNSCDSLHAFNDNGKKVIGGINIKVNEELMKIYNAGFNPDITNVDASINSKTGDVRWSVTINQSTDGNAYTGFYTRGGGGTGKSYPKRLTDTNPIDHTSIVQAKQSKTIKKRGTIDQMYTVYVLEHYPTVGCKVKQFFYKYTLKEYPTLPEQPSNIKTNKLYNLNNIFE